MTASLSRARKIWYGFIIVAAIPILYLSAVRGIGFFLVPSESMEPTFQAGDYILTLREPAYYRGDVVVLHDPVQSGEYLVKRVVGVAGDVVKVDNGALYINGRYASEPYLKEPPFYAMKAEVVVESGRIFVLGDNRNRSDDSSSWTLQTTGGGPTVSLDSIVGRVRFRYLPFSRMGRISSFPLVNAAGE
ncbi:MAG TPA: signal peptidase I [Candidatus Hydrogenedentes bacterium]|nr:signal peptidase I [Candidatus Hydrogenedentota bacterium]HOS01452.1 signal peptidase I [Candidatus Hydrogenedentota bacterium]